MNTIAKWAMLWLVALSAAATPLTGDQIPLWPDIAPGPGPSGAPAMPSLTVYLPHAEKATGAGVVVCPGGGYGGLALGHEGEEIAQWLLAQGMGAFVVQYRHGMDHPHPAPLNDARRAVQLVRHHAEEWNIDPNRLGMMGFSAGGHLTATAGVHFFPGDEAASDPVNRQSPRPDFLVLLYPVITLTEPHTHLGSRRNLLGDSPDPDAIAQLSPEQQVTPETPPTFLVHTADDAVVPVENSILFFEALKKAGVPAELHIYEQGRHGLGLAQGIPGMGRWPDALLDWLQLRGMLEAAKP